MYNSMFMLPTIPYNILVYLARQEEAEDLWKMLKYSGYDALSKPNLTFSEKLELIWRSGPQDKFGVFFTPLVEDMICESKCVLKIYDYYIHAKELYTSTVVYAFDFLYGGQMSLVVRVSRGDLFINKTLSVLNGAEVGGVGKLTFLDDMSRYSLGRATIGNSKTFTGVQLFLAVNVGDTGINYGCET